MPIRSRILVVDDNEELRSMIADVLRIEGYSVCEAGDGIDAMEQLSLSDPDAVLMDMRMPRQGGLETLKEIRRSSSKTPVIFLSGVEDAATIAEAFGNGAADYISKEPLDFDRVLGAIRKALGPDLSECETRRYLA